MIHGAMMAAQKIAHGWALEGPHLGDDLSEAIETIERDSGLADLLEACKAVACFPTVWFNDPDGEVRDQCWQEAMRKVHAAIAKATGKD